MTRDEKIDLVGMVWVASEVHSAAIHAVEQMNTGDIENRVAAAVAARAAIRVLLESPTLRPLVRVEVCESALATVERMLSDHAARVSALVDREVAVLRKGMQ